MCSICKDVLKNFGIEHTESKCPLRNSYYCSYCAKYGHLSAACPAIPSVIFRQPAFIEQLIPASDRKKYNITTMTPIELNVVEEPPRLLEIKDNDKVISTFLASKSIKAKKGNSKRHALEEYAKLNNRRLVYIK